MTLSSLRLASCSTTSNQLRHGYIFHKHFVFRNKPHCLKRQIWSNNRQRDANSVADKFALSSFFVVGCAAVMVQECSARCESKQARSRDPQNHVKGNSLTLATSPVSPNLDLKKLQADWNEFHLESLRYNDEDDDDDEDDDEEKGEEVTEVNLKEKEGVTESDDTESREISDDSTNNEDEETTTQGSTHFEVPEAMAATEELDKELYPDDFSDLPEKDEDTTCSICLINRQGPCRNPWRRFEKCIKANPLDHDDEKEPDDTKENATSADHTQRKCDHLFKPWFFCFSEHRVTYSMITNKQMQEEADFLEEANGTDAMPIELRAKLDEDDVKEMPMEPSLQKPHIQKYLKYPLVNPKTNNPIRVAYVRDEEGNILGFDHFKKELEDGETEGDMMFHVPADATFVTAYSFYSTPLAPSETTLPTSDNNEAPAKDSSEGEQVTSGGKRSVDVTNVNLDAPSDSEKVYFQHIVIGVVPKSTGIKDQVSDTKKV